MRLNGIYSKEAGGDDLCYANGTLLTGIYNNVYYDKGALPTKVVQDANNGVVYGTDGKPYTGDFNSKFYEKGHLFTGFYNGTQYVAGLASDKLGTEQKTKLDNSYELKGEISVSDFFKALNLNADYTNANNATDTITPAELMYAYMNTENKELKKILSYFVDDDGKGNIGVNKYYNMVANNGSIASKSNTLDTKYREIAPKELIAMLGLNNASSLITKESLAKLEVNMKKYEIQTSGLASKASQIDTFSFAERQLSSLPKEYQEILSPMYDFAGNPNRYAWNLLAGANINATTPLTIGFDKIIGKDKAYFEQVANAAKIVEIIDSASYNAKTGYVQGTPDNKFDSDIRRTFTEVLDEITYNGIKLSEKDKYDIKEILALQFATNAAGTYINQMTSDVLYNIAYNFLSADSTNGYTGSSNYKVYVNGTKVLSLDYGEIAEIIENQIIVTNEDGEISIYDLTGKKIELE